MCWCNFDTRLTSGMSGQSSLPNSSRVHLERFSRRRKEAPASFAMLRKPCCVGHKRTARAHDLIYFIICHDILRLGRSTTKTNRVQNRAFSPKAQPGLPSRHVNSWCVAMYATVIDVDTSLVMTRDIGSCWLSRTKLVPCLLQQFFVPTCVKMTGTRFARARRTRFDTVPRMSLLMPLKNSCMSRTCGYAQRWVY